METNETIPDQTAVATEPQPTPLESIMKPISTKKTPWIVIVLVIMLVGVAGYFGFQNYQLKQQLVGQQPTLTPSPSPQPAKDPTTDWILYKNSKLGFSIKHPSTWESSGDQILLPEDCHPNYTNPVPGNTETSCDQGYLKFSITPKPEGDTEPYINLNALLVDNSGMFSDLDFYVPINIKTEDEYLKIDTYYITREEIGQILSTLEFTN